MKPVINEFTGEEIAMKGTSSASMTDTGADTPIPVSVKFDQDTHDLFEAKPTETLPEGTHEAPGFFSTLAGSAAANNELSALSHIAERKTADSNPIDDHVSPDWSPMDDRSVFIGIDPRNNNYLLSATGPEDLLRRRNLVLDNQEHDERISRGSIVAQALGGFAGAMASPSSWFPLARILKHAKLSQQFIQTIPKIAGGIALSSASHEAVLETARTGGNLHDWAVDTAVDTVMGTALVGAHLGVSHMAEGWKLYNARGVLKILNDGVEARPVVDDKGVITGIRATPVDNSVGAAQVDMAQAYLDSALSKSVIHHIPYIGEMIGKPAGKAASWLSGIISPKIRMMNSDFQTIRGFTNNYAEHSFDTEGMKAARPVEATFQTMMDMVKGSNITMKAQYDGLFLKRNGIEYDPDISGSRTKANLQGTVAQYFRDGKITRDQFGREVQYALINDTQSDIAAVNDARNLFREHMDPIYLEYLKLYGISDKIMEPVTSTGYLSRVYWTGRMELEEPLWMEQVPQKLKEDDGIINSLNEPVRLADQKLKSSIEEHEKLIRGNLKTYYRGYGLGKEKPESPYLKNMENVGNDSLFGKGYWFSENKELPSRYGNYIHEVKGDFRIYDVDQGNDKDINHFWKNVKKSEKEYLADKTEIESLEHDVDLFRKIVKDKGYNGLKRKGGVYDSDPLHHEEIMFFDIPESIKSSVSDERIRKSSENIEDLRRARTAAENRLQDQLRDDRNLHRHIEDRFAVSASEAKQIEDILKPKENIESELAEQKKIISNLKEQQAKNRELSIKAKTSETALKRAKMKDAEIKTLEAEEKKLSEIQDRLDTENELLQERMHNREIPQELYTRIPDSYRYKLKDPNARLKTRPVYESDHDRRIAAKAYYDSILNQTAEDNIRNILDKASGAAKENPLVQRTLMIDDKWLYDNNWLHPDPSINVMNYRNVLGRKIAQKKMLDRLTVNGTFEELIQKLSDEYSAMKNEISKKYPGLEKQDKNKYDNEVTRLGRKYRKAKDDLGLAIMEMQGKSPYSPKGRELSRLANLYAVSTKLGFLAMTMSTDNMGIVFRHGLWPYISDGLFPMLRNLGGMINTPEGKAIRENAAHAYVGMRHVNFSYSDKNWTGTTQTYEPVQGKLTKGLETLAHYSNNFSLANYVENFNERFAATVINSKIMRAMRDYTKGTISGNDMRDLLRYGLDPKIFAGRFLKGSAEKPWNGAGLGHYWEWADKEASNMMSQAIGRAVRDTIIRRGPLDAPFAMNNPVFSSIFLFKGYVLASMTRYLAPLLQQATARQLVGATLMMAAGATQNPLRRLVAGQDPMEENEHMFRNAVRDGGVFSILGDAYEEANFLTQGRLQETVTNERYRGRTEMGVFNGPIGAMANDMTNIIGAVASGEMNQTDLKRIAVNTPFVYSWQFRNIVNQGILDSGFPKTRAAARRSETT